MAPKTKSLKYFFFSALLFLGVVISCSKFESSPPEGESSWVENTDITLKGEEAMDVSINGAKIKYTITSTGGRKIFRIALCYSATDQVPDTLDKTIELGNLGAANYPKEYLIVLKDLTHNTKYFYRLYLRGFDESGYSTVRTFTTLKDKKFAEVSSGNSSGITLTSATLDGNIISAGEGNTSVTQHGHVWSTQNNPTINDNKTQLGVKGNGTFSSSLTNLSKSTKYFFRAYATNSYATVYGETQSFNTNGIPVVNTSEPEATSAISLKCVGEVTNTCGYAVTSRGICWSTSLNPTIADSKTAVGNGVGLFTGLIQNLTFGTTYYVRAYATNSEGTAYGEQKSFKAGTVKDIDGNVYTSVKIGNQYWMTQNLKVTKYRNGDVIGTTSPANKNISSESNPKYQWAYNGNEDNVNTYGRLYTVYTAIDTRKLCPSGWHIPSNSDWTELANTLGGANVAGGKLKETGTSHWLSPNLGATDQFGFKALPGGQRQDSGEFLSIGNMGLWLSSETWTWMLYYNFSDLGKGYGLIKYGQSVRCISD